MRFRAVCDKFKLLLQNFRKTKQDHSETEGNSYPLFFACKNRLPCSDRKEQMKKGQKRWLSCFLALAVVFAGWYLVENFRAYVVLSGSMEPEIPTGAVVILDGRKQEGKPGEVITYRRGTILVTHRILREDEHGYVTKGDANREEDTGWVTKEQIRGKVIAVLPWIGYGIVWLQQKKFLFLFFFALPVLSVVWYLTAMWHEKIKKRTDRYNR